MKKVIFLFVLLINIIYCKAQFPKISKPDINKGKSSSDNNKSKESPKINSNSSSAADKEVGDFKREYPTVKEDVKQGNRGAKSGLTKLSDLLGTIKAKDASNKELPGLEAQYNDLKAIYEKGNSKDNEMNYFEQKRMYANGLVNSNDVITELKERADSLDYKNYESKKSTFLSKYPDQSNSFNFKELDKFYNTTFNAKVKPKLINRINSDLKEMEELYVSAAPTVLKQLDQTKAFTNKALKIVPDDQDFKASLNNEEGLYSKIKKYIDSGEYDKWVNKHKQELIDAVKMDPAKMKDPAIDALIKSKMNTAKYGTPFLIHITNDGWQVKQNELGIPLNKFVFVHVATKKDGKCYFHYLWVRKDHQGGGNYGSMYLDEAEVLSEMNCNNAK